MTTEQTLQQAASNERSVSQERAFIRGAGYATAKACTWLENELPKYIMEGREGRPYISVALVDDFKKAMKGGAQ